MMKVDLDNADEVPWGLDSAYEGRIEVNIESPEPRITERTRSLCIDLLPNNKSNEEVIEDNINQVCNETLYGSVI